PFAWHQAQSPRRNLSSNPRCCTARSARRKWPIPSSAATVPPSSAGAAAAPSNLRTNWASDDRIVEREALLLRQASRPKPNSHYDRSDLPAPGLSSAGYLAGLIGFLRRGCEFDFQLGNVPRRHLVMWKRALQSPPFRLRRCQLNLRG